MDGLMTEATGLVLSATQNLDPTKVLKWHSKTSSENSAVISSMTLMRMSITKSIKDRSQSEVVDTCTSKRKKSKQRRGSWSGNTKIDVQTLNSESDNSCSANSDFSHETKNSHDSYPEEQNNTDVSDNALKKLFTEGCDSDETDRPRTPGNEANDCANETEILAAGEEQQNTIENGLKLASRKFSDSIFENCSTYSINSPDIVKDRENSLSSKKHFACGDNLPFIDTTSRIDSADNTPCITDSKKSASADRGSYSEDPVSLSDSFFVSVNEGDDNSHSFFLSKGSENSRSSRISLSKENSLLDYSQVNAEKLDQKNERRLSKKWRKKQKKNKSNNVPTYDCPKCGGSYILSTNASHSTACCLHCDFCKSVEPVFMKSEKQAWNTCRIC